MSHVDKDLRVRRTQKLIRDALISLLEEHSLDSITVGDITERAMVSRTVFYRYYHDKYELIERMFEENIAALQHDIDPWRQMLLNKLDTQTNSDVWGELFGEVAEAVPTVEPWTRFFNHFAEHERMYRAFFNEEKNSWFSTKMRIYIINKLSPQLGQLAYILGRPSIAERIVFSKDLIPTIIATQVIEMVRWWLKNYKPLSADQMGRYCYRLICAVLKDAATWE